MNNEQRGLSAPSIELKPRILPAPASDVGAAEALLRNFEHYLLRTLAKNRHTATDRDRYHALALAVRDRLVERWVATQQAHHKKNVKRVYYLSLEFLIGRLLGNNEIGRAHV